MGARHLWLGLAFVCGIARAEDPGTLDIRRVTGPITVDGDLSDEAWKDAVRVDTFYETNPGDNVPPKVRTTAWLAYDDRFLYAAFKFDDPHPERIRAPYGDRDNVPSYTDYGGIILDTRHDGKTGLLLLANPRGIQYDAITDDSTGNEDSSPDFHWDSAARITAEGWVLEMRVPFSSLRYPKGDPQTWGILLYRNYPRDFRYQMFSAKLPRGGNCFICNSNPLVGLAGLPSGGHLVAAPYLSLRESGAPEGDPGSRIVNRPVKVDGGIDVKWTPSEAHALDATINPDFSQVESDVAQVSANERFALFYPEKRPFFLEGIELFSTPIQAVYTRTITSPRWGLRATGKFDATSYTALVAEDRGGGSVILPGPVASDLANQDFSSFAAIGRVRHDLGKSFVSFLVTDRENAASGGGGHNRVLGPDFQFRPSEHDSVTGQLLLSDTQNPNRPDLAADWTGQRFRSHAGDVWWSHSTRTIDWFTEYKDFGDGFRADDGFVPQVGTRENYLETGYTFRPKDFALSRIRTFVFGDYTADRDGALVYRTIAPGVGMDGLFSSFTRLELHFDKVRAGDTPIPRTQLKFQTQLSPSNVLSLVQLVGTVGQEIDFANARPGHGTDLQLRVNVRPTPHLELQANVNRRWLDVTAEDAREGRLFTAQVERLRATYTFSARSFVRVIGQYVETRRDPSLYHDTTVPSRDGGLSASALFAYKLNWQTVLFLGYDDNRILNEAGDLLKNGHEVFLKVSYAFQR